MATIIGLTRTLWTVEAACEGKIRSKQSIHSETVEEVLPMQVKASIIKATDADVAPCKTLNRLECSKTAKISTSRTMTRNRTKTG